MFIHIPKRIWNAIKNITDIVPKVKW